MVSEKFSSLSSAHTAPVFHLRECHIGIAGKPWSQLSHKEQSTIPLGELVSLCHCCGMLTVQSEETSIQQLFGGSLDQSMST